MKNGSVSTCLNRCARKYLKELREPRKSRAVFSDAKLLTYLAQHRLCVANRALLGVEAVQKIQELWGVEGFELAACGTAGAVHVHIFVEAVLENEAVCYSKSVRLHGVLRPVVKVAYLWLVEVRNLV